MTGEDFRRFCEDYDVAFVVGSRDRADILARRTDLLASEYRLFYSGDGYADYDYNCIERVEVPRGIHGHAAAWNHILRSVEQKVVILMDDDVRFVYWLGETHMVRISSSAFLDMLCNLVINALDAKVGLFGISDIDIRKVSPLSPFQTRAMIGCITGIVGRGVWYDERNIIKDDYDHVLQHLKTDRFVWKDMRYFIAQDRNVLAGGQMTWRTIERENAEVERLKAWWGDDIIHWRNRKGTKSLSISL